MQHSASPLSTPPLWREESININFRLGGLRPSSQILFLFSPMSAARARRFEFRIFSCLRPRNSRLEHAWKEHPRAYLGIGKAPPRPYKGFLPPLLDAVRQAGRSDQVSGDA